MVIARLRFWMRLLSWALALLGTGVSLGLPLPPRPRLRVLLQPRATPHTCSGFPFTPV